MDIENQSEIIQENEDQNEISTNTYHDEPSANKLPSLQEDNTCFSRSIFNGINAILGNGILVVPYALAIGGWMSLMLMLVVVLMTTYTSILIIRCMKVNERIKTMSDIGSQAFGRLGNIVVSIVFCAELYMFDTGFLILEGDNLHYLFPHFSKIHILGIRVSGKSCFVVMTSLVLLPSVLVDDLKILSYFSAIGIFSSFILITMIGCTGVFGGVGFHNHGAAFIHWKGIPTAVSLYLLCFSCHPVFPVMYTSTKKKRQFSQVLIISFLSATIIYALIAVLGCLIFGAELKSEITLNLPKNLIYSKIATYTILITPIAKYALLLKPVVVCIENLLPTHLMNKCMFKVTVRMMLVASQVAITLMLPFFGHLMSLCGALFSTTTALILPSIFYLKISNTHLRHTAKVLIWGIIGVSILLVISGTYISVVDLLNEIPIS